MAGAPKGNNNASTGRQARHALELALTNYDQSKNDPYEKLEAIGAIRTLIMMWKPIITKALVDGDLMAMKEINDRLDGRARQSIDIADKTDSPDEDELNQRIADLIARQNE